MMAAFECFYGTQCISFMFRVDRYTFYFKACFQEECRVFMDVDINNIDVEKLILKAWATLLKRHGTCIALDLAAVS